MLNHFCARGTTYISITKLFAPGYIVNWIKTCLKVYWITPGVKFLIYTDDMNVCAEAFPLVM